MFSDKLIIINRMKKGHKANERRQNTLYDRINKLLVSRELSDCSFSVCGKKIKAHKLLLGVSSPVFEAMFYGPLCTSDEIIITDIEPTIFQLLLNYIYTDELVINSIEEAYNIMYASRKYMLESLTDICIFYIQSNMDIDNVITVLNYPDYIQDNVLVSSALRVFCQHADYLLKENKTHITITCMKTILNCNEMNISEKDLIKEVFAWTTHYCDQSDIKGDFENRREVLIKCGLLKNLRLFTLSMDDIDEIKTCQHNLLLNDEIEDLRQVVKNSGNVTDKVISSFDTKIIPRHTMKLHWCLCHRAPFRSESPLVIDPVYPVVHTRVKASKSTFITSFNVQTRMAPVFNACNTNVYFEQFTISVKCESSGNIITTLNFKSDIPYDSNIDVKFLEPFLLRKNLWYDISVTWPQSNSCNYLYALESREEFFNSGKILFEFDDLTKNGGSFLRGLRFCM